MLPLPATTPNTLRKQAALTLAYKDKYEDGEHRVMTYIGPEDAENHGNIQETPVVLAGTSLPFSDNWVHIYLVAPKVLE